MVIHVSSTLYVFLKRTYWSVFVRSLLNLIRRLTPWVKFYFGLSLHIFSMVRHCLWKMCATPGACINETWLFSSAAVVPPSKSTELPSSSAPVLPQIKSTEWCSSSAAVVPHKVNLTELCSGSAAVVPHKENLTELWSSAAPFHLDLWYFRHRTNKHVIYSEKTYKLAHSSAPQVTEINKLDQITKEVINVSTHIPLKALMIHLKRVKLRGVVFVNQCSNTFNCARDVHHKKCGLGSLISAQVKKISWQWRFHFIVNFSNTFGIPNNYN